jgi:N-acyl-D-amino-acid deacylase
MNHHFYKAVLLSVFSFFLSIALTAQKMDLILRNGRIIDGTGNPWYIGDIGIRKGKIKAIGDLREAKARRVIDIKQQVIAPGFIDVHAHLERSIPSRPEAENFLYNGVTTLITGNCGGSTTDLKTFFKDRRKSGMGVNVASLIGHNSVRQAVMGEDDRAPTPEELEAMKELVAKAMRAGAVGLSTGLIYTPGTFAETEEVVELAKVAAEYGGIYASHIRNEDHRVFDAIEEAVYIGKAAGMPVEISHFKITNKANWGRGLELVDRIRTYRREGIDVTVDQYPYTASSTRLGVLLPSWALAGGRDSLNARLEDPNIRAAIAAEMKEMLAQTGFDNYAYAYVAGCPWEPVYEGKNISEINQIRGNDPGHDNEIETILEMMSKGVRVQMVYHKMSEEDVQHIMQFPLAMIASDAGIPKFDDGSPHPRAYGTNARVLGRYVREQGIITLEEAIRKMTSLPAQRFQLSGRGLLRPGYAADLVVFDPATVSDRATFEAPHAYSTGFSYVLVNGVPAIEQGKYNGERPGTVVRLKAK